MKNKYTITKADKRRVTNFVEDFEFLASVQNYDKACVFKDEDNGENHAANIEVQEDYKRVTITVFPSFFKVSRAEQAEYLVHEFCHILINPINQVTHSLIAGDFVTPKARTYALEQSNSAVTEIMVRFLKGKLRYAKRAFDKYIQGPKKRKVQKKKKK